MKKICTAPPWKMWTNPERMPVFGDLLELLTFTTYILYQLSLH